VEEVDSVEDDDDNGDSESEAMSIGCVVAGEWMESEWLLRCTQTGESSTAGLGNVCFTDGS
jgi:hypothetical protein